MHDRVTFQNTKADGKRGDEHNPSITLTRFPLKGRIVLQQAIHFARSAGDFNSTC